MSQNKDNDQIDDINKEEEYKEEDITISDNDSNDVDYKDEDEDEDSMDDFIDNTIDMDEEEIKKFNKEMDDIVTELKKPKLHLNPYPTLNTNWKKRKITEIPEFTNEKDRIKWLIENHLGPNFTLEDYIKFLEEQEKEAVDNYIRKSKRHKTNKDSKKK
jgi:hypothetical protein